MKPFSGCPLAILPLLTLSCWNSAFAQVTPSGDASTFSGSPATNYGASTLLNVTATQTAYIQFDLASIPFGAVVSQATLKLYVNSVSTGGSFDVDYVGGAWSESTLDYTNAPPLGNGLASNVAIADANQYILINITQALIAWLNGSQANYGVALVANGAFHASFDSKENLSTSHPPELDIVFASGAGTITTGQNTALGAGALGSANTGTDNTAVGFNALAVNTGGANTATGALALQSNTSGLENTATGNGALAANTTGNYNTGTGVGALSNNTTGGLNTATGIDALWSNTTGNWNTATGVQALYRANTYYTHPVCDRRGVGGA
jgi:hypothetical protein